MNPRFLRGGVEGIARRRRRRSARQISAPRAPARLISSDRVEFSRTVHHRRRFTRRDDARDDDGTTRDDDDDAPPPPPGRRITRGDGRGVGGGDGADDRGRGVGDDTAQRLEVPNSWIRNDEPVQVVLVGHGQARGARGVAGALDVSLRRFRYR